MQLIKKRRLLPLSLALMSTSASMHAFSQPVLEEVIVTSQRRAENLQDVPIAVTALSADDILTKGLGDIDDLGTAVPGLNVTRQGNGPQFFLRGVGTTGGQVGQDTAVTIFVDGIYMPGVASGNMELADIERIEVLKGPQGTLFGRNATGGLVNIITRTPDSENSFRGEVGYGRFDTVETKLFANVAYSESVAQNFSVYYRDQGEGWGKNIVNGNDVNKSEDVLSVRTKLRADLSERASITVALDYAQERSDISEVFSRRAGSNSWAIGNNDPAQSSIGFYDAELNVTPKIHTKQYGGAVTFKYDFDNMTLTSLTGYRKSQPEVTADIDQAVNDVLAYSNDEDTTYLTQELQLSGSTDRLQWVTGLYYLDGESKTDPLTQWGDFITMILGFPSAIIGYNTQEIESTAAYAQGTWSLSDSTRLTAGIRYTRDERSIEGNNYVTFNMPGSIPTPISNPPVQGSYLFPFGFVRQETSADEPTWRIALDHDLNDDTMVYVSYNRGFKSGGFNATSIADPAVQPETLDAYEVGMKSTLLDGRLRLNLSGYFYQYDEIQLTKHNGAAQILLNAAEAEMYGVDAEFVYAASDRLMISGGVNFLNAEFKEFTGAPEFVNNPNFPFGNMQNPDTPFYAGGGGSDFSGNTVPKSPELTANVSFDYDVPLSGDQGGLRFNLTASYNDGFYWEPSNRLEQDSYVMLNSSFTWTTADDRYYVRLWGKNLLDEELDNYRIESLFADYATAAAPRTYGIAVGVNM